MKKPKRKKSAKKMPEINMASSYDVLGSYTGCYLSGEYEDPVQDADDL